jgi:hypothetical protein
MTHLFLEGAGNYSYAYKGLLFSGIPLVTVVDNSRVYKGFSYSGTPLFTIYNNKVFMGNQTSGTVVGNLVNNKVYKNLSYSGAPLATIHKNYAYTGNSISGTVLVSSPSSCKYSLLAGVLYLLS